LGNLVNLVRSENHCTPSLPPKLRALGEGEHCDRPPRRRSIHAVRPARACPKQFFISIIGPEEKLIVRPIRKIVRHLCALCPGCFGKQLKTETIRRMSADIKTMSSVRQRRGRDSLRLSSAIDIRAKARRFVFLYASRSLGRARANAKRARR